MTCMPSMSSMAKVTKLLLAKVTLPTDKGPESRSSTPNRPTPIRARAGYMYSQCGA